MDSDMLIFKGKPVAKPRMTKADTWKKRKVVTDYWAFKDEINKQAKKQKFTLASCHRVVFHLEIPKSRRTGKNKVEVGEPHIQRPDLDNLLKGLWDSLLVEDSGVFYVVAVKKWSDKPKIVIENFPDNLDF